MFYVYILENRDNKSLYIGFSRNLRQRVADHNSGKGSRFTKRGGIWTLIYYEAYRDRGDAIGRERFLKSGSGRKYIYKQLSKYLST